MKCDIQNCKAEATCTVDDHGVDTNLCPDHAISFWHNEEENKTLKIKMGIL
jgi:hypothetical protein